MDNTKKLLKDYYHVDITSMSSQQGGWASLAYKVSSNQKSYFLKVYEKKRASTAKLTALIDKYVPIMVWLVHNSKLKGKIPVPLVTRGGEYKCEDEHGIYMIYDYIEGYTIGDQDVTEDQVRQLSEIIAELHLYSEDIPVETDGIKEDFDVPFLQSLRDIWNQRRCNFPNDVWNLVSPHIQQMEDLMHTIETLGQRLRNSNVRMALCHTDLHGWNLMQSEQQLIVIDWEGLKVAPVEADLMFLIDKPFFQEFLNIYQKTHHNFSINPDALQFYQGKRKLEDIWEFLEQLLWDEQNEEERVSTLNHLQEELKTLGK
ncbi:aminoglycoside phosphotransferase family protein [Brevibacillus panacihumi]|uniref:Aminoglycoside phosphotransferase family protein n=1 Tax=Brevibacillus panacihumi TaxID=497735 RepID=A0A3M8CSA1_9BACL|nr:aminoglycoside phosphotransferase family protein [Brevibacillus panacihumi]RNB78574.1 aminoglycoside phosphotransferase family protein [Brevibacillus panacihumi]